ELVAAAHDMQSGLQTLKATTEKVLRHLRQRTNTVAPLPYDKTCASANGAAGWTAALQAHLTRWQESGNLEDCPLPELYRNAREAAPALTIGQFHDGLRRLHENGQIALHPWTGPLSEMPEPGLAMLVGHEIVYYANERTRRF